MQEKLNNIYEKIKDIKYGWFDKNDELHDSLYEGYSEKFKMQTNKHIEESRIGVCWETVELAREYLKKEGINCKTYLSILIQTGYHCHTFLVVEHENKYYWLEASFKQFKGVHVFNSLEEIFQIIIDNFHEIVRKEEFNKNDIRFYEYDKPKEGIFCVDFFMHCFAGKRIK